MIVFLELIGNDICKDRFSDIPAPEVFKANILKTMTYLDTVLPKGSHLWMFGLVDGRVLYQYLHNLMHPLNVSYTHVYDFLNCLKISPCWTWMNSNDTVRETAYTYMVKLNNALKEIVAEKHVFKNYDYALYDLDVNYFIDKVKK